MKSKLSVVTMKISSGGYGTDAAPSMASNVILVRNLDLQPLKQDLDDAHPVAQSFGAGEKIQGAAWSTVSFDVVIVGGGTPLGNAGTVPNHDPVLRACAMARTLNPGTGTTYNNIDGSEEDATLEGFYDTLKFKMLGLRGSWALRGEKKKALTLSFNGIGLRVPVTDVSFPAPTLPTMQRPLAMNKANTFLSIDSYTVNCERIVLEQGNEVTYRNNTGVEEVCVLGRESKGSVLIEMPKNDTKDLLGSNGIITNATPVTLSFTHGTVSGNKFAIGSLGANVQLLNPKIDKGDGVLMIEADLHFIRNQFSLTYY